MTNQQGAPEARCQACIDRHDGFYGSWAPDCPRHNYDGTPRSAALLEAQQPAQSAAAAEHYDEVRATLTGLHALCENISAMERRVGPLGSHARGYTHKITAALRHLEALVSPTPQADSAPADQDGEAFRTAARLGLTLRFYGGCAQSSMPGTPCAYEVVGGQDRAAAMRDAVERAAAVIARGGEPQRLDSTAPQADSQPAHDYPPLPVRRRAFLCTKCGGRECEPGTLAETHPTCKCGYLGFAEDLDFTADDMRAYVDADRAARAPADSVTAPTGGGVVEWREVAQRCLDSMDAAVSWRETGLGRPPEQTCMGSIAELRHLLAAPPAQAADSVLEDAALLDWQASARVEVSPEYEGPWHAAVFGEDEKPVFLASGNTPREALIAARKQGGA